MPLEYPNFKLLGPEDIPVILDRLKHSQKNICEFSLANLMIWRDFDRPQYTLINHNLCILNSPQNEPPFYLEPLGGHKAAETVELCLKHAGRLSRVSEAFLSLIPAQNYKINCLRDHFDYIYPVQSLAEMKGRKLDGKRNHVKKFMRRHPDHEYVPLSIAMKDEALTLFEAWFEARKESRFFPRLAYDSQKGAIKTAFSLFNELGLKGGALYVGGTMKGFTLGSFLNPGMISVHFLYGHPSIQGIAQALLWEACNKTYDRAKYINLEQDLGIPGLRKSKLSYQPMRLEKKYEIRLKGT